MPSSNLRIAQADAPVLDITLIKQKKKLTISKEQRGCFYQKNRSLCQGMSALLCLEDTRNILYVLEIAELERLSVVKLQT